MASITSRHGKWRVKWRESGRQLGRTFADETEAREFAAARPRVGGPAPTAERIARMTTTTPAGCWQWSGRPNNAGYGQMTMQGANGAETRLAHRVAYETLVGPIPAGLQLDHLCRNRLCVNPTHLEPVTARENILRSPIAEAAKNARKTHCPQGHPYSGSNLYVLPSTGYRYCRECMRAHQRRRSLRKAVTA